MKKILLLFLVLMMTAAGSFAAKLPVDVQNYLKKNVSGIDIRFDGVIIFPDGTLYLPLYPASFKKPEKIEIAETYPGNMTIGDKPEVVIFNNDFSMMKIITDSEGRKTVRRFDKPPIVIKTGLLPQDMLVPSGLIIPENIKGVIGNLDIKLSAEKNIKVAPSIETIAKIPVTEDVKHKYYNTSTISQLKNKSLYMVSSYTKNISVVNGESLKPDYALELVATPIDVKITKDNKFLLVTSYDSNMVNVISIADDKIIKQFDLTSQGGEIVMDYDNNKAYIAAPTKSTLFVIDTNEMKLVQKIRINGRCERLFVGDGYIMYIDKLTDNIWSVELNNKYCLKNLGQFPNISKVLYYKGIVYLASRTKNRIAVLNYETGQLIAEFPTVEKPIDMLMHEGTLYVLGAQNNDIQIVNIFENEPMGTIKIAGDGFSTRFCEIPNSNLTIVTDTKVGRYTIIDLLTNRVIKTNGAELPVNRIIVGKKVNKIN